MPYDKVELTDKRISEIANQVKQIVNYAEPFDEFMFARLIQQEIMEKLWTTNAKTQ